MLIVVMYLYFFFIFFMWCKNYFGVCFFVFFFFIWCMVDKLAKQNVLFFFLLPDLHRFHFDIVCNVNGIIHVFALIK